MKIKIIFEEEGHSGEINATISDYVATEIFRLLKQRPHNPLFTWYKKSQERCTLKKL